MSRNFPNSPSRTDGHTHAGMREKTKLRLHVSRLQVSTTHRRRQVRGSVY